MIRVILVEDKPVIRETLAATLDAAEGIDCVGRYADCETMLAGLDGDAPDLALMDIGLPGMSGIEGIGALRDRRPDTAAVVLSVYEDDENVFRALCAGAVGYLVKSTPPERVVEAIHEAAVGGSPMSSHIARRVVDLLRRNAPEPSEGSGLSPRELDVVSGLADGDSYKMIADRLGISVDTVRFHIRNSYRKLHVHTQSAAVAKALRKGWI